MKKSFVLFVGFVFALCVAFPAVQAAGNQTEMKVDKLIVNEAKIDKAEIKQAEIELANIKKAMINKAKIDKAKIANLRAEMARFEQAHFEYVKIKQAEVELLKAKLAEIETANIRTANIQTANIGTANIKQANIGRTGKGSPCPPEGCIPANKENSPQWQEISPRTTLSGFTFVHGQIGDGLGCRIQRKWYHPDEEIQIVETNCATSDPTVSSRLQKAVKGAQELSVQMKASKLRNCGKNNCYVCEY